jgi:ribonuclease J
MTLSRIHTSGHAPVATMKKFCNGLKPKLIIPIHTNHPKQYQELFGDIPIATISDGVEFSVQQFLS